MQKQLLWVYQLGHTKFSETWTLQKKLVEKRARDQISDILLITEHSDVLTCGKAMLSPGTSLKKISGLPFHFVERGGSETYHGPGQVIGYPLIMLSGKNRDIHGYLRNLEEIIMRTVKDLGLPARRHEQHTGVWVEEKKVASIGIAVRKWVTYHGFAINVSPDLSKFHLINPCGLNPACISSLSSLLDRPVEMEEVVTLCLKHLGEVFRRTVVISDETL